MPGPSLARIDERSAGRPGSSSGIFLESFQCFSQPGELQAGLREAASVDVTTWQHYLGCGLVDARRSHDNLAFCSTQGWLRIYVMYVDQLPVAFLIGQHYNQTFYCQHAGYRPDFPRFSVGSLLTAWVLETLAAAGVEQVDLGEGSQEHNRRLGCRIYEEGTVHVYSPTLRGLYLNMLFAATQTVRTIGRGSITKLRLNRASKAWSRFLISRWKARNLVGESMLLKNARVKQTDSRGVRGYRSFLAYCIYGTFISLLSSQVLIGNLYAQGSKENDLERKPEQATAAQVAALTKPEDYVIGPDDLLNIYVLDVPELSRDYRVSATGTITIPVLATPLDAAGLTLAQFSDLLSKDLKTQGLVSDPHITMSVDQSRLHSIAIVGAVRRPQIYPVLTRTTLLDILSQAEGLADDAGNTVIVRRGDIAMRALSRSGSTAGSPEQPQADTLNLDLRRLLEGTDPKLNVDIYPGDRITVPRAGVIYVVGAVNKPGGFAMKASSHGMTVLQLLALAEDTKGTAKRDQTVIIRNDSQAPEGRKQIPIDLKAILRGKSPDPVLQAEDILFIPDSSGKRALNRGIESVVQAATGVAIYGARF